MTKILTPAYCIIRLTLAEGNSPQEYRQHAISAPSFRGEMTDKLLYKPADLSTVSV
jgi:hypothetical protein